MSFRMVHGFGFRGLGFKVQVSEFGVQVPVSS